MDNGCRFCDFLVDAVTDRSDKDWEKRQSEAYRRIKKALAPYNVVAPATLKLWCGIGGQRKPSREKLLQMAVVMQWTSEQLEAAFARGMQAPGIQVNDYQEIIYYYGMLHRLTLDDCEAMIHVFEVQLTRDITIEQATQTQELWNSYEQWNRLDKEHFLHAMCENAGKFKGYSRTALKYFIKYRNEILQYVRQDARNQLMAVLADTNFFKWCRTEGVKTIDYNVEIRRFLRNEKRRKNSELTQDQIRDITYYHWLGYSVEDRNCDLIMELFAGVIEENEPSAGKHRVISFRDRRRYQIPQEIKFMSNSYLSQMLHVGAQKERDIRLSALAARLMEREDAEACPQWALDEFAVLFPGEVFRDCAQAKKRLSRERVIQRKKCVLVERGDLLTLVHCLAQKRYMEKCQEYTTEYNRDGARRMFVELANATMNACRMPVICEDYALDRFLLSAFGEEEMLSYSELIEETAQ